jgi:hypothetical protein
MRALLSIVAALVFLAGAGAASAAPVQVAPVVLSAEFQKALADNYGEREGPILQTYIERALTRALTHEGAQVGEAGGVTVEVTLVNADATKPTFAQLNRNLGLDYMLSWSRGGAELRAVIRGADGHVLTEVDHTRYAWGIEDSSLAGTWGDAYRSIRQFAAKVARAYRAQQSSGVAPT